MFLTSSFGQISVDEYFYFSKGHYKSGTSLENERKRIKI